MVVEYSVEGTVVDGAADEEHSVHVGFSGSRHRVADILESA